MSVAKQQKLQFYYFCSDYERIIQVNEHKHQMLYTIPEQNTSRQQEMKKIESFYLLKSLNLLSFCFYNEISKLHPLSSYHTWALQKKK